MQVELLFVLYLLMSWGDYMNKMNQHILYLKAERPRRWAFLQEQLDKAHKNMSLTEIGDLHSFVKEIFEAAPYEYETFNYLFWQKVEG